MPGSAWREQAGASVRAPSTSTTQTRQAFFGVSVSPWHRVGMSLPAARQASRIGRALRHPGLLAVERELDEPARRLAAVQRSLVRPQTVDGGLHGVPRGLARDRRSRRPAWPARPPSAARCRRPPPAPVRSTIRCRASSWRTVPTRQGTHWPQDSSRKNSAMRSRTRGSGTVSSRTRTTPEPSVVPAARVPSKVSGMSSSSGAYEAAGRPAEQHRPQAARAGPARSSSSPSVAPKGSS